ncbi:MAG: hypothetical protein JWQ47_2841 [Glaciihabitans sp.]|nr:hypothetical protein [Glaciihabitans sp.]
MSDPTRRVRGRLARAVAVTVLLSLGLAGCVGIPKSGGVNVGPPVLSANNGPPGADIPVSPPTGATKDEILTDFMQAVVSPENDYSIARQYLTQGADHSWDPTKSVLIREGSPDTESLPTGSMLYTVQTKAAIDVDGIYSEQNFDSSQVLSFSFKKVDKQWRISSLADGIVISRDSFNNDFHEQTLYFFDPTFRYLIPDVRWFPTGSTVQTRVVSALLGGPSETMQGGVVVSAFPEGTKLQKVVDLRSSTATVDLSTDAAGQKPLAQSRMLTQLQTSLSSTSVTNVSISVGGAPLQIPQAAPATVALAVDPAALVRQGKKFGFAPRLDSIGKISAQVAAVDASAVTLSRDQSSAAALGKGGVYLLSDAASGARLVDSRNGLIAPSIDPFGYVWSVPTNDPSNIRVTGANGKSLSVAAAVPRNSKVVALQVSHDGTRVLMYLKTTSAPRLVIIGVVRRGDVPTSLGVPIDLPVSSAVPIDATWVDADSVAALGRSGDAVTVTTYTIGGTAGDSSTTGDAVHIVGGSREDQLRVITSTGEVLQLASSGWQETSISASVLATQQ